MENRGWRIAIFDPRSSILGFLILLISRYGHLRNLDGWRGDSAAHFKIRSHHFNILKHLLEISGDRHLFYRIARLSVFNPEAGRAAG